MKHPGKIIFGNLLSNELTIAVSRSYERIIFTFLSRKTKLDLEYTF